MTTTPRSVYLVGSASGIAAQHTGCEQGPQVLKDSEFLQNAFTALAVNPVWEAMLVSNPQAQSSLERVSGHCKNLAEHTAKLTREKKFFLVFGGDHSCAIGTWSGAASEIQGDLGLIWIDAHMDAHTPETTPSGNIHGMPVASLLGQGYPQLTSIMTKTAKIKPENLCLIGVRSFEEGESELLKQLKVRVYYMPEVKERGLDAICKEALAQVTKNTVAFGVTLDLDSIDPLEAPGTGCWEPDGLSAEELCAALTNFAHNPHLVGAEIVEFDPSRDQNQMTEKLLSKIVQTLLA
jgi:arginase